MAEDSERTVDRGDDGVLMTGELEEPQPGLRLRLRGEAMRLSTQHEQLNTFFEMVVSALERGSLASARLSFVRFCDALEAHIGLEDRVFFPALRGLRPDLTEQLTRLVEEHTGIRLELDQLRDLLAAGSAETFGKRFAQLGALLSEHERREDELLELAKAR